MRIDKFPLDYFGLSDANRPIRLFIKTAVGLSDDLFLVHHVTGHETICGGLEYAITCLTQAHELELKEFIACPVQLQFVTASGELQAVSGIVSGIIKGDNDGALASYQLIVQDAFSLLEHSCTTRIFRDLSELDITRTILQEWRQASAVAASCFDIEFRCTKRYPTRTFTMQYNESTANFLRRLWKRRGIAWFIQSGPVTLRETDTTPAHTLILFDSPFSLKENPAGPAHFHRDDATDLHDSVYAWQAARTLTAGRIARRSWNERRSGSMGHSIPTISAQGALGSALASSLEEYVVDPPDGEHDDQDYRDRCVIRMQRKEFEAKLFHGESGDRDMRVGTWRRLDGHPEIDAHPVEEREFVITKLRVEARNNLPKALNDRVGELIESGAFVSGDHIMQAASENRGMRYTNRFTCVRRRIPIVPTYDPRVDLPHTSIQTALVVGPENNEIYCDAAGRIKIRFPATRTEDHLHAQGAGSSGTERDSCWVRLSSGWAGSRYGMLSLPRAGDEVVVVFLGGDPDMPLVVGRVHGGNTPPPSFDGTSSLPGDRYLSGVISREGQSHRANQMRMDDTPGQISTQLASEHGHSQLNLGYLVHPRCNGKADPRGVGAELRTDGAIGLRGANGILISADASLRAAGRQLERDGLLGLTETLSHIQNQLAQFSEVHHATVPEQSATEQLLRNVKHWEAGSNTCEATGDGGAATVAVDAPAGILLGSGAGLTLGAQTHIDAVSIGNTQLSAGRRLLLGALEAVSVFAHSFGMKLIAASGKVEISSHDDDIEVTAAKRIVLTASDEIVLQAPKVSVITQGAQTTLGSGVITQQCTDTYTVKSSAVVFAEGGAAGAPPIQLPESSGAHDQRVRMVDMSTGEPLVNQRYRATMEDGQVIEGTTDSSGMTQTLMSTTPFARFAIEAVD